MRTQARWLVWVVMAAAGCKGAAKGAPSAATGPASASASASVPASAAPTSAPARTSAPAPAPASVALVAPVAPDGGAATCRIVRGPIELPRKAPASIDVRENAIDIVQNDDGRPRVSSFPTGPIPTAATPAAEPVEGGATAGLAVPCAIAGERVFCPDRTGAVHRSMRDGSGDRVIASSRSWTHVAAALLGGTHAALAYLSSRKTTEGWVSEAWLEVDDEVPVRISEDGAGATAMTLASRGAGLLAVSVDARSALTAMHARVVTYDGKPRLGEDEVVFVGGPGDRRTRLAVAAPPGNAGPSWALLPIAKDIGTFGLAVVRLDEPPHVDEPVAWSIYPNGLDPAPVAAAIRGKRTFVARVRPGAPEPGAARVLELGEVGPDGSFLPEDLVATRGSVSDVSLATDTQAGLWVAWVDAAGAWLERLACR